MAANTTTLNGTWVLNQKKSDSIDDVLAAQGVGWAKRKIISGLAVTETVAIMADKVTMAKETSVKNTNESFLLNTPQDVDDDILGPITVQAKSENSDKKLVMEMKGKDGSLTTTTRSLSDDGKLVTMVVSFTDAKGKNTSSTRYFDRKS